MILILFYFYLHLGQLCQNVCDELNRFAIFFGQFDQCFVCDNDMLGF